MSYKWTFSSHKADIKATVITAKMNEDEARQKAMDQIWGPPKVGFPNRGESLPLDSVEEINDAA